MKPLKLIAALTILTTASAFAADAAKTEAGVKPAPVLASAAAPAAAGVATAVAAPLSAPSSAPLSVPSAAAKKEAGRARADVRREAVEAVRSHENTLSRDLGFYTR